MMPDPNIAAGQYGVCGQGEHCQAAWAYGWCSCGTVQSAKRPRASVSTARAAQFARHCGATYLPVLIHSAITHDVCLAATCSNII
ncbi:hypothetical protein WJX72_007961 [[Myrmecia] bisecta]|uniref:Uncharacterized protein n=1 Tax=[Myrmecia] bisecta TaxID=41462 RepID=A0AAW1PHX8_9CHLO